MKKKSFAIYLFCCVYFISIRVSFAFGQNISFKVPSGGVVKQVSLQQYTATGPQPIAVLTAVKDEFTLLNTSLSSGIYELIPDDLGRLLFVYNGQKMLQFSPTLEQIKQQEILPVNEEQIALADLMAYYQKYRRYYMTAEDMLREDWAKMGAEKAVNKFVHSYALNRKGLSIRVDSLMAKYPNTLTAKVIATMFRPILPMSDSEDLVQLFHTSFFKQYNFDDEAIFNNPFFYDELKTYFMFFATQKGELYNSIDILLSHPSLTKHSDRKEKMIEILTRFLLEMQHPKAEKYIMYMDDNYAASCSGQGVDKKGSLATRIRHTQPGAIIPPFVFNSWQQNSTVEMASVVKQKPYTLLYFWMSTCDHCKITGPFVEKFAEQFKNNLNTVAVALDESKQQLEGYLKYSKEVEKRERPTNWIECWEQNGFKSEQLNQIYIKGTPFFILLDSEGKILEKSNSIEVIQNRLSMQ